jgi:hypothetical protein
LRQAPWCFNSKMKNIIASKQTYRLIEATNNIQSRYWWSKTPYYPPSTTKKLTAKA